MNNYVIISDDKVTIDLSIKSIIKKINIKDLEIVRYNYPDITINNVLEDLNTYNLLSNCKLIIYEDCSFLNKEVDKSIKELKKYLINPSDNYFIMINDSISEKKDIKELLKENVTIINNRMESDKIVLNNLDFLKMDNNTIKYFCNYCLNNNEKILNELEKIKNYKYDEENKNVSIEDINNIVVRDYNDDIFDLVNAIIRNNKNKMFELYHRLIQKEKDSVNIIASVAGSIRNLYSVKVLIEKKYKQIEISEILGIKPYAVSIAMENCNNYSSKKLLSLIDSLAEIDYRIKSGNGDSNLLFEIFLLSL